MEKFRARNFNLILYEEDETHKKAIEYIKKNYDFAMILHDRDVDNITGEIKKPHYHFVIRFQNARWNTSLAEDLGITPNYIEESRSLKRSLLYLIHYYDEDKYQYSLEYIEGSLKGRLLEIIKNGEKTENEKMQELLDYIDNSEQCISIPQFIRYCVSIGYTDVVRRDFCLLVPIIEEHNTYYEEVNIMKDYRQL